MPPKQFDRAFIVNVTLVVEGTLLLIAMFWSRFAEIELLPLFHTHAKHILLGIGAGLLCASSGFIVLFIGKLSGDRIKWIETLRDIVRKELAVIFATITLYDILLMAASSGFCEEVFFRGILQNQLGLLAAAVLFGFFHCPSFKHMPYGVWATCAGIFLGWLLLVTNCLWTPILAHGLSNLIVLLYLRYYLAPRVKAENESES